MGSDPMVILAKDSRESKSSSISRVAINASTADFDVRFFISSFLIMQGSSESGETSFLDAEFNPLPVDDAQFVARDALIFRFLLSVMASSKEHKCDCNFAVISEDGILGLRFAFLPTTHFARTNDQSFSIVETKPLGGSETLFSPITQ